ncbi:MAG: hypothetical protein EOP45_00300 [Sphingobacteriaceae bacterium]|nr:MAG: hypothetical protein EOP45_00300 [Sphingobacteriaceae bacterium]
MNMMNNKHSSLSQLTTPMLHAAVGQLLADAHADKSSATSNTRLSWSFGSGYEQYAEFIATLFSNYCKKGVYSVNVVAKKGGDSYTNYRLKTATLPVFNALYDMFYVLDPITNKRVKIVPLNIDDFMSAVTLAHLIMGDGGYNKSMNIVRIYTYNFTLEDCNRLSLSISNLGIFTEVKYDRLGKNGDKQYILKIDTSQLVLLRSLVLPHMDASMHYRVGIPKINNL